MVLLSQSDHNISVGGCSTIPVTQWLLFQVLWFRTYIWLHSSAAVLAAKSLDTGATSNRQHFCSWQDGHDLTSLFITELGSISCDFIASYVDMLLTCVAVVWQSLQEVQDAFPLGSDLWCRPRLTCRENSLVNPPFCTWQKLQPHHQLSLLIASQSALRSPLHLPAEFHLNIEIGAFWTKGWFKSDWRKSLLRLGGLAL